MEPYFFDLPSDELFDRGWSSIEEEADAHLFVFDVTRKDTLSDVINKWTRKLRGGYEGNNALWSRIESHLIMVFPMSKVSGQANECVQRSARARQGKRMRAQCERMIKQTSKWLSTSVCILDYSGP